MLNLITFFWNLLLLGNVFITSLKKVMISLLSVCLFVGWLVGLSKITPKTTEQFITKLHGRIWHWLVNNPLNFKAGLHWGVDRNFCLLPKICLVAELGAWPLNRFPLSCLYKHVKPSHLNTDSASPLTQVCSRGRNQTGNQPSQWSLFSPSKSRWNAIKSVQTPPPPPPP